MFGNQNILWGKIADIQNGCVCLVIFKIESYYTFLKIEFY